MQPDVVDYASAPMPRRRTDPLRFAPVFAMLCAAFAWLKSVQYHGHGQLADEQVSTLIFVVLSLPCLIVTLLRFRRYRCGGRAKVAIMLVVSVAVVILDWWALWNLHTAVGYRLL